MKPENILNSDVIDIVFENRNKAYGAYQLRKNYGKRMNKSLAITTLIVIVFALSQSFKVPVKKGTIILGKLNDVDLSEYKAPKEPVRKIEQEQPKTVQKKDVATAAAAPPIIVKDRFANNNMSDVYKMDTSLLGGAETDGKAVTTEVGLTKEKPTDGPGTITQPKVDEKEVDNGPLVIAEFMPEFPGGREALIRFLQNNLRQPGDFEEGQKITVVASFVVGEDGFINAINIVQNGREDLDKEVVRVIKKMPRWKAGMQNGRSVSVYYKVPVTFVSNE